MYFPSQSHSTIFSSSQYTVMKTQQISGRIPLAHFGRGLIALTPPEGDL